MSNRVLICGLPNAGKTTFAKALIHYYIINKLPHVWYNGDVVRRYHNDWDFTLDGRLRQTKRIKELADKSNLIDVIIDYVCPLEEYRTILQPTHIVYMDTKDSTPYKDTLSIFQPIQSPTIVVSNKDDIELSAISFFNQLKI